MKSNRRVVLVCDWQTSYSKRTHDFVLGGGVGKRPSAAFQAARAGARGQNGASFQYAADMEGSFRGEGRVVGGEGCLRWMRFFHFIHAEQFKFYSTIEFLILFSSFSPLL